MHDSVTITNALVCEGAVIKEGAIIEPGSVVGFKARPFARAPTWLRFQAVASVEFTR